MNLGLVKSDVSNLILYIYLKQRDPRGIVENSHIKKYNSEHIIYSMEVQPVKAKPETLKRDYPWRVGGQKKGGEIVLYICSTVEIFTTKCITVTK